MAGIDSNAAQVADALGDLAAAVHDLTPANDAAAAITLPIAVERSPRRTGRLAASLRSVVSAHGYGIVSDVRYAVAVHARNPWIAQIVTAREAEQVAAVEQYLNAAIAAT